MILFSTAITHADLARIQWFFDDKRARIPFAGRTQTRFSPNLDGSPVELENTIAQNFGRYHSFVRTTGGATCDLEISCKCFGVDAGKPIFLTIRKGKSEKSYHWTVTPFNGERAAVIDTLYIVRKPKTIVFEFGGDRRKQFRLLKCDIATGSGRGKDSPQSIMWGDGDNHRFDLILTEQDFEGKTPKPPRGVAVFVHEPVSGNHLPFEKLGEIVDLDQ